MSSHTLQQSKRFPVTYISSVYLLANYEQLNNLYDAISGLGFTNFFKNIFSKPIEAITSLRMYPIQRGIIVKLTEEYAVSDEFSQNLRIGKTNYKIGNAKLDSRSCTKRYLVGYFINRVSSYIDYSPYTTIQIYLPYLSFIEVPANEIANSMVYVYYAIDWRTGVATVTIERKKFDEEDVNIIATTSGKIGIDLPIGSNSSQEVIKNVISTGLSTAISLSLIGTGVGAFATASKSVESIAKGVIISKSALSIMNNLQVHYERGGGVGTFTTSMLPSRCYMIVKKPKLQPIDNEYRHLYGLPLYKNVVLSTLGGFTVVEDIHLENFPTATSGEMDEIERLLKSGVHL